MPKWRALHDMDADVIVGLAESIAADEQQVAWMEDDPGALLPFVSASDLFDLLRRQDLSAEFRAAIAAELGRRR